MLAMARSERTNDRSTAVDGGTSTAYDDADADPMFVLRVASSVVIAFVGGVVTFLAGVGGATRFPPEYVFPVAAFVALGLFVAFYIDLTADA